MKEKKFIRIFFACILILALVVAILNVVADPFNVFGDRFTKWYTYDFTQNPRTAKIEYIKGKDYKNFILGASGASSIPTAELEKYTGKKYFNLFSYGADLYVVEKNLDYILKNYEVESVILPLSIPSALRYNGERTSLNYYMNPDVSGESKILFYARYLFANPRNAIEKFRAMGKRSLVQENFDVFSLDGSYDKSQRDIEYIGSEEDYKAEKGFNKDYTKLEMAHANDALEAIRRMKKACDDAGVELTMLLCPMYKDETARYDKAEVESYYKGLAEISPFWDFTGTEYENDPRFFYDPAHFRNALGKMMLETIYAGRKDFGRYVDKAEAPLYTEAKPDAREFYIFELHHIDEDPKNPYIITKEKFESVLKYLKENNIETVSFKDIYDYVNGDADLPEKFCVLTFDDGYRSNYTEAYPLLKKYGAKATIFPVGKTMGLNKYPDTDKDIYEHFSAAEAKEMAGVIEFGSHTYWMHQAYPSEKYTFRKTAKRLPGESEETYVKAFKEDSAKFKALYKDFADGEPLVFAYPEGDLDGLSELIAEEEGYKVTLGVKPGKNYIVKGLPETLKKLKRINIDEKTDISEYE